MVDRSGRGRDRNRRAIGSRGGWPADLIDVADVRLLSAKRELYRERGRPERRAA